MVSSSMGIGTELALASTEAGPAVGSIVYTSPVVGSVLLTADAPWPGANLVHFSSPERLSYAPAIVAEAVAEAVAVEVLFDPQAASIAPRAAVPVTAKKRRRL